MAPWAAGAHHILCKRIKISRYVQLNGINNDFIKSFTSEISICVRARQFLYGGYNF